MSDFWSSNPSVRNQIHLKLSPGLHGSVLSTVHNIEHIDHFVQELVRTMSEPRNAVLKQFTLELKAYGAKLDVTECAQRSIAREAKRTGTGARGLRSLLERMLLEARYQAPEHSSSNIVLSGEGESPDHFMCLPWHPKFTSVLDQVSTARFPQAQEFSNFWV